MVTVTLNYPQFFDSIADKEKYTIDNRVTRKSYAKHLERQVIRVWKVVTGATRKHQRASMLPRDFVLVTSRRRSILPSAYHHA